MKTKIDLPRLKIELQFLSSDESFIKASMRPSEPSSTVGLRYFPTDSIKQSVIP